MAERFSWSVSRLVGCGGGVPSFSKNGHDTHLQKYKDRM